MASYSLAGSHPPEMSAGVARFIVPPGWSPAADEDWLPVLVGPLLLAPPPHAAAATVMMIDSDNSLAYRFTLSLLPNAPFQTDSFREQVLATSFRVYRPVRGSSASRSPSPTRLKASGVRKRNRPGKSISHQATVNRVPASESICPHDGVVGGTPTPRNDSAASNRMLLGMIR